MLIDNAQIGANIMRYLMKQKFFSLSGAFYIKNDQSQDMFRVEGKVFIAHFFLAGDAAA
jgi:uncharacterized protein YxjI